MDIEALKTNGLNRIMTNIMWFSINSFYHVYEAIIDETTLRIKPGFIWSSSLHVFMV